MIPPSKCRERKSKELNIQQEYIPYNEDEKHFIKLINILQNNDIDVIN